MAKAHYDEDCEKLNKTCTHVNVAISSTAGLLGLPGRMGTIRDLSRFDAHFFGVNEKQAHMMDPQMRLLLETSYEAIVDAGYEPETMRGRNVGVFIGCGACDSDEVFSLNTDRIDGYGLAGSNRAMLSNRISYSLDFHGMYSHCFEEAIYRAYVNNLHIYLFK